VSQGFKPLRSSGSFATAKRSGGDPATSIALFPNFGQGVSENQRSISVPVPVVSWQYGGDVPYDAAGHKIDIDYAITGDALDFMCKVPT
jgi:hypothetical protein